MSVLQENFFRGDDENHNSDIHSWVQEVEFANIRLFVHKNVIATKLDPHIADTGHRLQPVKMRNCQSKSQTKETVTKTYKPYRRAILSIE